MLGASITRFTLKSREALHSMGDLQEMYDGGGGGTLISFHWNSLLVKDEELPTLSRLDPVVGENGQRVKKGSA